MAKQRQGSYPRPAPTERQGGPVAKNSGSFFPPLPRHEAFIGETLSNNRNITLRFSQSVFPVIYHQTNGDEMPDSKPIFWKVSTAPPWAASKSSQQRPRSGTPSTAGIPDGAPAAAAARPHRSSAAADPNRAAPSSFSAFPATKNLSRFAWIFGEPQVDVPISFEQRMHAMAGEAPEPELVSSSGAEYRRASDRYPGLRLCPRRHLCSGVRLCLWPDRTPIWHRAIAALREVEDVRDHLLVHLSPLGWEHANLTGRLHLGPCRPAGGKP